MTIEEFYIDYLGDALGSSGSDPGIPVSGSVPHPLPDVFVTVEKTGGRENDKIPEAQLHVKCWHTTRAAAAALSDRVSAIMQGSVNDAAISRCVLTAAYNNPDLETKKPRYSASFQVIYLF